LAVGESEQGTKRSLYHFLHLDIHGCRSVEKAGLQQSDLLVMLVD